MSENVATTVELKESQMRYLDEMAKKYKLPDRSKALRCLINYVTTQPDLETAVFEEIRCVDC